MKIAIPNYAAPDSFVDNVATTLRAMGHTVLTPTKAVLAGRWARVKAVTNEYLVAAGFPERSQATPSTEKWLLEATRIQEINMVLALTQPLSSETLLTAKRRGVAIAVAWWGDAPGNMKRLGILQEGWDLLCFKDAEAAAKARRVGFESLHLHEAMNPLWHKVVATQGNDSVVIAGNWYAYRQLLARRLANDSVNIAMYGPPVPRWGDAELKKRHTGRYIVKEEKSLVFGEALGCLNSTHFSEGNSLNCRAFEIAGAGGLQFIENRPAVSDCFEPGREVLTYGSYEELADHIERATRFPTDMRRIREAAAERARSDHTYEIRLREIFRFLNVRQ
jgi:spore maturation protein CgeB